MVLLQINHAYGDDSPIITIDFASGNIIDLDTSQMLRANIEIQNYDPRDGFHYMQIIKTSDNSTIKDTEIMPKVIDDNLYGVQVLHYIEPDANEENLIGNYQLRIYSEYGPSDAVSEFSVIKSSQPTTHIEATTENTAADTTENIAAATTEDTIIATIKELGSEDNNESEIENLVQSESKIPSWVHDIFVWYADETISEDDLLTALSYLIEKGILEVNSK